MNQIARVFFILLLLGFWHQLYSQNKNPNVENLLKYHVPLEVILPEAGKIEHSDFNLTLVLSPNIEIEILKYQKADWIIGKGTKNRTIQNLIEEVKLEKEDEKMNILEEEDNLILAKLNGSLSFFRPYWLAFFTESDESIYQFYSYPKNQEEIESIKKILSTVRYIDPCRNSPLQIDQHDRIIDFKEYEYPVKISFPADIPVETEKPEKTDWGLTVKSSELNYRISIDQYVFGNDLEQSIVSKKKDHRLRPEFLSFVKDDPQGFLVEFEEDWTKLLYIIYYFHRSDEYYYAFETYYRATDGAEATKYELLRDAQNLYERFKGASIGKLCE